MSTALKITSAAFHNGGSIPEVYTCKGKNISPPLSITGVPDSAKSLTLIMEDPDAPMGTWDHWIVFNINPKTAAIGEDEEPAGIHGKGSGDNLTYVGPCPPSGIHRYYFKVYALDIMLSLSEGATKDEVYKVMAGHILADGELVGKYGK
ncbi:YbhB/YbcL family Raf kinase inhibitor-like protein [Patescibacteria group bacterium]|nr:YbhB/YbcL family Raf kinase inhibitor-like protein [Patescibacteria group bacterium]MDE1946469.1 YbhB/YbcL family Raf kinase inhibitor-like protein [Patescibacteria group bacterium]MDE2011179.1 YbhB/YbcL family Raf kinase inhibitor-like protein [Patescibacteria group bacterium]MDE2233575.1 YbhB/YbcL family Raf kinase inhibitor-like protein [Patescibacteria group bacterium]